MRGLRHTRIGVDRFNSALNALAKRNSVDPFAAFLDGLPDWDGEERINTLLQRCFDVAPDYDKAAGRAVRSTVLACMHRVRTPGYKHDTVAVLIGPEEGFGKSTF